jgi:hypothetical protein
MLVKLARFGIQVQVVNPGGFLTGFNETEAESSSHWMDERTNYFKSADVQAYFDELLGLDDNRLAPQLMADFMVEVIPKDTGLFRNVFPDFTAEQAKTVQHDMWEARIDLPTREASTAGPDDRRRDER